METKLEKIGNVILDMTYYPGQDLYSDGDIEDEMLDIAMNYQTAQFPHIIEAKQSWPIFYHFSPFRANIIDWIPFKKTDKVLEIGSGCGAITQTLAKKVGSVTCIDLSKKRSMVNAYRNKECDNIKIIVGNFKDIEPELDDDYDYVLLIGVFEYGIAYIGGDTPYEDFMRICNRHRKHDGHMVIAIENKFGLKYFAGCREDHLGTYFAGLEGYHDGGSARTFTRHGLEKILAKVGIDDYEFYYPYPDYKFMTTIYSDKYLPKKGELSNNIRNFDRERVILFDETLVFDQIIEENEFSLFSNSYLLMIGNAPNVVYTKFSNDRADKWAIKTSMVEKSDGALCVRKTPATNEAIRHIENMHKVYNLLSQRYAGTKIEINKCSDVGKEASEGLDFEFCKGVTLESMLDGCVSNSDKARFRKLIDEYMYWLGYKADEYKVSNIDFIFPNIIVDGDKWQIIDYEWTYDEYVEPDKIAFRAFYNYCLGGENRKKCEDFLFREVLGIDDDEIQKGVEGEKLFQQKITAQNASVDAMREIIGNRAYELEGVLEYYRHSDKEGYMQLFFDYGDGFKSENMVIVQNSFRENDSIGFEYVVPNGAIRARIDPVSHECSVFINKMQVGEHAYGDGEIEANGYRLDGGEIVFATDDPNIIVSVKGYEGEKLCVVLRAFKLPKVIADKCVPVETVPIAQPREGVFARTRGFLKHRLKGNE